MFTILCVYDGNVGNECPRGPVIPKVRDDAMVQLVTLSKQRKVTFTLELVQFGIFRG